MFLVSLVALNGCGGPTVAAIELPEEVVSHRLGRVDLQGRVLDAAGEELPRVPLVAVAVADESVARLGKDGSVACERLGRTQLEVQAGELTQSVPLNCLLISAIKPAQSSFSLRAGSEEGQPLQWIVLDLAGQSVEGVPVKQEVDDPSVARLRKEMLYGILPGRTVLRGSAGELTAEVAIRVGRLDLKEEGLVVPKAGTDLELKAGEWTLTISAQDEVTVEVSGGRCSETDAQLVHHLVCRPATAVKLHIEPTGLLRKSTTAHVRGVFFPGN